MLQAGREAASVCQLILEGLHLSLQLMRFLLKMLELFVPFLLCLSLLHQFGQLRIHMHFNVTWGTGCATGGM